MNYVRAGFSQISTAAQGVSVHETISLNEIIADREGYILAYLSNENAEEVAIHWDDFTVYHGKTNVVSASSYYPFGLQFGEYQRTASTPQRYLYNGKELQEKTNWLDYGARMYMPDLGRFFTQDRFASKFYEWSPYHYANNTPINAIDFNGDSTILVGWNNWVGNFNSNFHNRLGARLEDPSLLLDDVNTISSNILQTLGDFTGLTTATGYRNQTAESLEAGFNTLSNIPNMSKEEIGALLAAGATVLFETIMSKKVPGGRGKNKLKPDSDASGPHSSYARDDNGDIFKYETYSSFKSADGQQFFNPKKRFDGGKPDGTPGAPHNGVPTPHINEGKNARIPNSDEFPNNDRFKEN
ncbi:MAG: RHS repeat-associated core domain-containing protein [Bacteroidota bacterium]